MAKKPVTRFEYRKVSYEQKHWHLLRDLRAETMRMMEALDRSNIHNITHGSIARGDISEKSDIDIFIPHVLPSFTVEMALENSGISMNRRLLVQATPIYALKAHIEIDERSSVSFPLVKLRPIERDFYTFGGEIDLSTLRENVRVKGVDKRLMLIEPTSEGHIESTIVGREDSVARLLDVLPDIVFDRVKTLKRRDQVGRTGVFIEKELSPEETFEMVLKKLSDTNPAVRRRLRSNQRSLA
jgi:predicted nucleotidyltransferase